VTRETVEIVYDGACPFCSNYVSLLRLRDEFNVRLVDARVHPNVVADFAAKGMDLADGMIVRFPGSVHHGADAMIALSMISTGGWLSGFFAHIFRHRWLASLLYPGMKLGRRIVLALLGISRTFENQP